MPPTNAEHDPFRDHAITHENTLQMLLFMVRLMRQNDPTKTDGFAEDTLSELNRAAELASTALGRYAQSAAITAKFGPVLTADTDTNVDAD